MLGLLGSIASGIVALEVVTQTTVNAEARDAYVGLATVAIVTVIGTREVFRWLFKRWRSIGCYVWPLLLLGVNVYVFFEFLLPFRSL